MDDQMGGPQWTPADELLYADVQKGLGQVRKDLFDGEVHPDHAAPVLQELTQKAAALDQRRKQADDQAMGEQFHKAAHAAAMQQSLLQANAADTARGFPSAVGEDPVTGQRFAPPGWQQIDRPEADGSTDMSGYADPETSVPLSPSSVSQGGPQVQQNPDGTQQMTIWNGQHRTEATFGADGKLIGQQHFGPTGEPVQAGAAAPPADRIRQQASRELGRREPPQFIPGPHGRPVFNPVWGHWDTAVRQIEGRIRQKEYADTKEHGERYLTNVASKEKTYVSEWHKQHPGEDITDDVHSGLADRARKAAAEDYKHAFGRYPPGYTPGGEVKPLPVGGTTAAPNYSAIASQAHIPAGLVEKQWGEARDAVADGKATPDEGEAPGINRDFYERWGRSKTWADMPKGAKAEAIHAKIADWLGDHVGRTVPYAKGSAPAAQTSAPTPAAPRMAAPASADEAKKNLEKIAEREQQRAKEKAEAEAARMRNAGGPIQGDVPGNFNIPG